MDIKVLKIKLEKETGQQIKEVIALKRRKTATTKSYLLVTPKHINIRDIRRIDNIDNIKLGR